MTHKEFYNWTKQYLGTRLESEKIDTIPIVEKLEEINDKEDTQKQRPYMLGDKCEHKRIYVAVRHKSGVKLIKCKDCLRPIN